MPEINEIVSKQAIKGINEADKSINSLDESTKEFNKTIDELIKSLNEGNISFDEVQKAQKQTKQNTQQLTLEQKKLAQIQKQVAANTEEVIRAKIEAQQQTKKTTDRIKEQIAANKREIGSIDALRAANKKLLKVRNSTSAETEKGRKQIDLINKKLDENNKKIKENSDTLTKQKINVGNYKESVTEALEEQEIFGGSLAKLKTIFTSTAGAIGAGVAILAGLAKAYTSSARGAEDLARATDRLNSISKQIGNTLADSTGEVGFFDKILGGLQAQFLGVASTLESNVEVAILSTLRQLEALELEQERQKKEQLDRAEVLRQIRDEERNSLEERQKANEELGKVINEREAATIAFQEEKLQNYKALLDLDEGNLELQRLVKQTEFEIADAREEAQGFRSEQLINELALSREVNENQLALEQKRIEESLISAQEGTAEKFALEKELIDITKQLQLKAAGENVQLQEIARQDAINAEKALIKEFSDFQLAEMDALDAEIENMDDENFAAIEQNMIDETTALEREIERRAELNSEYYKRLNEQSEQNAKDDITRQQQLTEARNELIIGAAEAAFEIYQSNLERESMALQQQKEYELMLAGDNADARDEINRKYAAKESELRRKAAIADKAAAITKAIINSAVAITSAYTTQPAPVGIGLGLLMGALTAVQIATILAQPIPQFWKGTDNAPDGLISVGERGRELIQTKSGQLLMANNPTITSGLEGAKIYTNKETEQIMAGGYDSPDLMKEVISSNNRVARAIENQPIQYFETSKRKITERRGEYTKVYLNKKLYGN